MLCLLVQPQEELQLTSKQIIPRTDRKSNCMELTTKDLKKPHSSRWVGGAEPWSQSGEERKHTVAWRGGGGGGGGRTDSPTLTCGG